MKPSLRSPSLFLTFAGAFLGVLLLGAVLQGFVVFRLGHSIADHLGEARAARAVRSVADEVGAALGDEEPGKIRGILDSYSSGPDAPIFVYRSSEGTILTPSRFPRRFALHVAHWLETEGGTTAPSELPSPSPPTPEPPTPPPPRPPGGGPPGPRGPQRGVPPQLQVLARVAVSTPAGAAGEILAFRLGPAWSLPRFPFGPLSGLLLALPLAVLLAAVAGLLLFRIILRRIRQLEAHAERIAAGDLQARVHDPGADEIGRLGAALNVMTERLAQARQDVESSERQRRQLFADISHELATPLTAIRGYTETLLDPSMPFSSEERTQYLQSVAHASERLGFLVEDLLELTRFEAGAVQLSLETLDWSALCRNTVQRFRPQFGKARLHIQWEGSNEAAWIRADGRRMEQVIDNLLANAMRYVPSGGHVTLSLSTVTENDTSFHRLVVADDGPGFPPQELQHVFERFYRSERVGSTEGSGLGLAIVREIVRQHGGRVAAANRDGAGALVEVLLPALEPPHVVDAPAGSKPHAQSPPPAPQAPNSPAAETHPSDSPPGES